MRALGAGRVVGFAFLAVFPSCSLLGLDDFEHAPCSTDADCAAATAKYPPGGPCDAYVCVSGTCVQPDGVETCNGKDDDCDGLVDDGVAVLSESVPEALPPTAPIAHTSIGSPPVTYVAVGGGRVGQGFTLAGRSDVTTQLLEYASSAAPEGRPCPTEEGHIGCDFSEVALAGDAEHLVFVAVNQLSCGRGQVRIGMGDRSSANPYRVQLAKAADATSRSACNIANGIDIDVREDELPCTGSSRLAIDESAVTGASRPAAAVLDTAPGADGAVALWLARPQDGNGVGSAASCTPIAPVMVEALGVFVPEDERSAWLNGTNDGKPLAVGRTTSDSPPGVVAVPALLGAGGYVVAFAGEGAPGGLELHALHRTNLELVHTRHLHTILDPAPGQVALAVGRGAPGEQELGVAWISGCGSSASLEFAVVGSLGSEPSQLRLTVASAGEGVEDISTPELFYAPSGFSVEEPAGGWFVLWLEGRGNVRDLKVARVTEREPEVITIVTLRSGGVGYPLIHPSDATSFGYALVGRASDSTPPELFSDDWCR